MSNVWSRREPSQCPRESGTHPFLTVGVWSRSWGPVTVSGGAREGSRVATVPADGASPRSVLFGSEASSAGPSGAPERKALWGGERTPGMSCVFTGHTRRARPAPLPEFLNPSDLQRNVKASGADGTFRAIRPREGVAEKAEAIFITVTHLNRFIFV